MSEVSWPGQSATVLVACAVTAPTPTAVVLAMQRGQRKKRAAAGDGVEHAGKK